MNQHATQDEGAMTRLGHRFAAIIAEMNYAGTRLSSAQHTPERY